MVIDPAFNHFHQKTWRYLKITAHHYRLPPSAEKINTKKTPPQSYPTPNQRTSLKLGLDVSFRAPEGHRTRSNDLIDV